MQLPQCPGQPDAVPRHAQERSMPPATTSHPQVCANLNAVSINDRATAAEAAHLADNNTAQLGPSSFTRDCRAPKNRRCKNPAHSAAPFISACWITAARNPDPAPKWPDNRSTQPIAGTTDKNVRHDTKNRRLDAIRRLEKKPLQNQMPQRSRRRYWTPHRPCGDKIPEARGAL